MVPAIPPDPATKPPYGAQLEAEALAAGLAVWFVGRDSRESATGTPGQPDRPYGKQGRWLRVRTLESRVIQARDPIFKVPYWWRSQYEGLRDDECSKYANGGTPVAPNRTGRKRKRKAPVSSETPDNSAACLPVTRASCEHCGRPNATATMCSKCGRVSLLCAECASKGAFAPCPVCDAPPSWPKWVTGTCRSCGRNVPIYPSVGECRSCLVAGF